MMKVKFRMVIMFSLDRKSSISLEKMMSMKNPILKKIYIRFRLLMRCWMLEWSLQLMNLSEEYQKTG